MGKASRPKSPIDLINELGMNKRKSYGLLRKRPATGGSSIATGGISSNGAAGSIGQQGTAGIGGPSNSSLLVKQITPQTHDHDTSDGVAVGWCPDGIRTRFVIHDTDVRAKSVVCANVSSVNGSNNYADRTAVKVQLINYLAGADSGFLILCESAPVSTDNLNYAIFNVGQSQTNTTETFGGGSGASCATRSTGAIHCVRLGQSSMKTDGTIVSVGVWGCVDGGNFRMKIYSSRATPTAQPSSLLGETDSTPLKAGWNDVSVNIAVPADPSNPGFGVVYVGVEFDSDVSVGVGIPNAQAFFRLHTYEVGGGGSNTAETFGVNVRCTWIEVI